MTHSTRTAQIGPDLVRRAQSGDADALRTLVERAYPLVRRWALVRTGDPAQADDLSQDVLVHVICRLGSYESTSRFTTWLYAVTRNAAADSHRKRKRRVRLEGDPRTEARLVPDGPPAPDAGPDRALVREAVWRSFQGLPPRQREVFDLAELQGLPTVEVGELMGIEPVSVRAHLFKARRALRAAILESHPEIAEEWS